MKKWLSRKRFGSNDEIMAETNGYFEGLEKSYLLDEIQGIEKCSTTCIELKGDFVEK